MLPRLQLRRAPDRAIDFVHEQPKSYFGSKEHLRARVDLEERHERLPNWLIRRPYRRVIGLTARVADRSAAIVESPETSKVS